MEKIPLEIWSKIFGYLDFETVQKTTTLVCKLWFDMIRKDSVLSGELVLNSIRQIDLAPWIKFSNDEPVQNFRTLIEGMKTSEINDVLSKWKQLKILRILNNWHPDHSYYQGRLINGIWTPKNVFDFQEKNWLLNVR